VPDAPKASPYALEESERLIGDLERGGNWDEAFQAVTALDPIRTPKLPRNDWYRLRRYLEIALTLNSPISSTTGSSAGK